MSPLTTKRKFKFQTTSSHFYIDSISQINLGKTLVFEPEVFPSRGLTPFYAHVQIFHEKTNLLKIFPARISLRLTVLIRKQNF